MENKIWIRLGGFVKADTEKEGEKIMSGDKSVLMSVIRRNGFEVNGESYIPGVNSNTEDIDFEFSGNTKLK